MGMPFDILHSSRRERRSPEVLIFLAGVGVSMSTSGRSGVIREELEVADQSVRVGRQGDSD